MKQLGSSNEPLPPAVERGLEGLVAANPRVSGICVKKPPAGHRRTLPRSLGLIVDGPDGVRQGGGAFRRDQDGHAPVYHIGDTSDARGDHRHSSFHGSE